MTKLLYYELQFAALHQAEPADQYSYLPLPGLPNSQIYSRYTVQPSFNHDSYPDVYDWIEFRIGALTWEVPDLNAKFSVQVEAPPNVNGGVRFVQFGVWHPAFVPDDFVIPPFNT